jgi:hypothetical protein
MRADTVVRQVPLLDLNTEEIAEQITLIEHQVCFISFLCSLMMIFFVLFFSQLFRAIEPVELLNQNWNKHPELSPHIIEYIQWFNRMCQWASTEIIREDSPESRAVIISKFIRIADRLAQLNNFQWTHGDSRVFGRFLDSPPQVVVGRNSSSRCRYS